MVKGGERPRLAFSFHSRMQVSFHKISMSILDNESIRRVRSALTEAGIEARIIVLDTTARSAQDAANAIGTELGSIVKSLVFLVGEQPVMVLVSGDRLCNEGNLGGLLNLEARVRRADANTVRTVTGFAIGGVAPVGLTRKLPVIIDAGLQRFETVYAAAGHPHCVFATTVVDLATATGGKISREIAKEA